MQRQSHTGRPEGAAGMGLTGTGFGLTALLELAPAPLFVVAGGRMTFVNCACSSLLGYRPREMMERGLAAFIHPDDLPTVQRHAAARLSGGTAPDSYTVRFLHRDGHVVHGEVRVSTMELDGQVLALGTVQDVTARVEAEADLRESEGRWRSLVQTAASYITLVDRDLVIRSVNKVLPGFLVEEVIGRCVLDFAAEGYAAELKAALDSVFRTGQPAAVEQPVPDAAGGTVWFSATIGPVFEGDEVVAVSMISNDVTERRLREEASLQSQTRWQAIVETAPDQIGAVDREARITFLNRTISGAPLDQVIGRPVRDFIEEPYQNDWLEAIAGVFADGQVRRVRARGRLADGRRVWFSTTLGPIWDGDAVSEVNFVTHDITEQVAVYERLEESQARLQALAETAPSYICIVDREGRFLLANRLVEELTAEDIYTHSVFDYVNPGDRALYSGALERVFTLGTTENIEARGTGPDGAEIWYSATVGPVVRDGVVVAANIVARDMSARKRMEENLRRSEERFRAIASAVSDVIFVLDRNGTFLQVLAVPERSPLVRTPEEFVGRRIHDMAPPLQADAWLAVVQRTIDQQEPQVYNDTAEALGVVRHYEARLTPITLEDGRRAAVSAIRDVTEQRQLEAELETLREEVESRAEAQLQRGNPHNLTFREITVLNLVASGQSDRAVAETLSISPATANKHISNVLKKMQASSRAEAVGRAVRDGII